MRGFVSVPLLIGGFLIVLLLAGGGYWFFKSTDSSMEMPLPTPTNAPISVSPSPTASPAASAKAVATSKPTAKPTVKPSASPTPAPAASATEAPKTGCAEYDAGGSLGSLKVNIQAESGQQLVGDAAVTIKRKYDECKGVDPGFPLTQVISQGSTSTNFSGMRPGPFKIEVMYHGKTFGTDVGISSGDNSTTVTVSN